MTAAELLYGVARLPSGRRKRALETDVAAVIRTDFADRVLAFDTDAAGHYARVVAHREAAGAPISMADAEIAATCLAHDAVLATRNVEDFTGVELGIVNPWVA